MQEDNTAHEVPNSCAPLHTWDDVPCECGLTRDDVCGACGSAECCDDYRCWTFWHQKHNPTHNVSVGYCPTCENSF
jgi:hypothetical protein